MLLTLNVIFGILFFSNNHNACRSMRRAKNNCVKEKTRADKLERETSSLERLT